MTYEQAYEDHQYLWETYGAAYDMTGAYVDSEDLAKMLAKPTKKTAMECLVSQIDYWFRAGPEDVRCDRSVRDAIMDDDMVQEIADRHYLEIEF